MSARRMVGVGVMGIVLAAVIVGGGLGGSPDPVARVEAQHHLAQGDGRRSRVGLSGEARNRRHPDQ